MRWHHRFAGLCAERKHQEHSMVYLKGLMSDQERKSVEPIALQFARAATASAAQEGVGRFAGIHHGLALGSGATFFARSKPSSSPKSWPERQKVVAGHRGSSTNRASSRRERRAWVWPRSGADERARPRTARWACSWRARCPPARAILDSQLFLPEERAAGNVRISARRMCPR